ncbi:MAG: sugar kinase [Clostridia bacterium]|nr:sugar kinase [Clostridia bacterium]
MKKVVGLGDMICGLNAPGYLKLIQTDRFDVFYTGAEANVLAALSYMNVPTDFVTRLPDNDIAKAAVANLRKYGLGTSHIATGGSRMAVMFVETGAAQRSSKVVFDRYNTGVCGMKPSHFDWDGIFDNADTIVISGITPALSPDAATTTLYAAEEARKRGVFVSCDINYRASLWSYEDCRIYMEKILPYIDQFIINEDHAKKILGVSAPGDCYQENGLLNDDGCDIVAKEISGRYGPGTVALTRRLTISASDTVWGAMICENGRPYHSRMYSIHVVGRIGAGDAFAAGLIYSRMNGFDPQKKTDFATACGVLKHSISMDFNLVSASEALELAENRDYGRVNR